jgi:cytochrome c553
MMTSLASLSRVVQRSLLGVAALGLALHVGSAISRNATKGDSELGKYLSSECVTCHQITGRVTGNVPMIVAWPEDQFIAVMLAYKNKDRENEVMQIIAGKLSEAEISALAAYFGGVQMQPNVK